MVGLREVVAGGSGGGVGFIVFRQRGINQRPNRWFRLGISIARERAIGRVCGLLGGAVGGCGTIWC